MSSRERDHWTLSQHAEVALLAAVSTLPGIGALEQALVSKHMRDKEQDPFHAVMALSGLVNIGCMFGACALGPLATVGLAASAAIGVYGNYRYAEELYNRYR